MSLCNIISTIGNHYIDWKNVYYAISSILSAMLAYKTLYWIIGFFFTRKFKPDLLEQKNYYVNYLVKKNDLTLKYNYFKEIEKSSK